MNSRPYRKLRAQGTRDMPRKLKTGRRSIGATMYTYYRWVEMADAEVGRLYDAVMNSRFADNTVVIFTSDHGDGLGFHGNTSKGYMEEEAGACR